MATLLDVSMDELLHSFERAGYQLTDVGESASFINVEGAIVAALLKGKPRLHEGVPVLLAKNRIDYEALKRLIDEYCVWNEFGYFGNFASIHIKDRDLQELVEYCRNNLKQETTNITGSFDSFFREFQKPEEKQWNLIGAPSYNSLERQFRRYCDGTN